MDTEVDNEQSLPKYVVQWYGRALGRRWDITQDFMDVVVFG